MADYYRSRSYSAGKMQMEPYCGPPPPPPPPPPPTTKRSHSHSHSHSHSAAAPPAKLKKGMSTKSWSFSDPEFQRKRRVASYKVYSVEGKLKGCVRKSVRWLKSRYTHMFYEWR